MMTRITEEHHEQFKRDLRESDAVVDLVVDFLRGRGYEAEKTESRVAPRPEDRAAYSDLKRGSDLSFIVSGQKKWGEVKGRDNDKHVWTSRSTYPWGKVFLNDTHKWRRADPKPDYFFIVNFQRTHLIIVDAAETRPHWQTTMSVDRITGEPVEVYWVPPAMTTFHRIFEP